MSELRRRVPDTFATVTLVGGGPGDESLLTLAAVRALASAEVVLYDRLAPYRALPELAPTALHINVGKSPGHHAVPQDRINELLVEYAQAGKETVRFKGGDAFVFGRGSEEAAACRDAGVQVKIVPGISSCIAVPEAAGIPVTARGISHAFTVISGHNPLSESEFAHLAGLSRYSGATIVVLMGVANLAHLVSGLARHGLSPELPLAVIEQGFAPEQRSVITELGQAVSVCALAAVRNPAVIVIGEVVRQSPEALSQPAAALMSTASLAALGVMP